ncbi:MAG: msmE 23 [Herbinix sp.]|jgi:ABC-type glycerol-3-phosphate transport system substrate-binding protein|nr:msmE 23 [Herbinix sp.]
MKKLWALMLVGVMMTGILTGCSSDKTDEISTKTETETTTDAKSETKAETTTEPIAEDTDKEAVIQVFHYMTQETKRTGLEAVEAKFQEKYPNVTFENLFYNQGTDYFPQLSTALASGEQPEVIMGNPGLYPDLITEGYAMDLSDNEIVNSLNLSSGDLGDVSSDGKIFGFPIDFKTWGVFYNVKMFDELGLKVPTTQTELMEVCKKLEEAGRDPWIHAFADAVFGDIEMRNTVWTRALQNGDNDIFEQLMSGDKKVTDYTYIKEGLEVWQERMQWARDDAMSNNQDKSLELFVAGQGAMLYTGSWSVGDLVAKIGDGDFEFNFFVAPIDDSNSQKLNVQVDQAFMVNPHSEYSDMALKFMEFWITDGALIWSENTQLPLCTGVSSDNLLPLIKTIAEIKGSGTISHYGDFTKPFSSEFTTAWRQSLTSFAESCVSGGGMTPDECLVNMQALFDDIIATSY